MSKEMIVIKDLKKSFGDLHVLKGVNLTIAEKEVVVIIGPSGSGKSTLLRCINFLEEPTGGSIVIDGIPLNGEANINEIRKEVGMVFQRFNLFPHMTVMQNLMLAPMKVRGVSKDEAEKTAHMYLKKVGMEDKANNYPDQLSGGQQQRVAIARALCMKPKALLFDEPTSALDPEMVNEVLLFYQSLGLHLADTCTGTGSLSAGTELFAGYSGKSYSGYSSLGFSVLGIYSTVVGYAARCVIRSFSAH